LICKNLCIGITTRPGESVSIIEIVDVEHDTVNIVDSRSVVSQHVVALYGVASRVFVVALDFYTKRCFSDVFEDEQLANVATESSCRADWLSAAVAVEFFDRVLVLCFVRP
jgi:hypothetical protein